MSFNTVSLFCGNTTKDSLQFAPIEEAGFPVESCPSLSDRHVFHITGRWGRSIASVITPNANPFDIFASLSEAEAGNPFLLWDPESMRQEVQAWNVLNRKKHQASLTENEQHRFEALSHALHWQRKPILLFGKQEEWEGFNAALDNLEKCGTLRHGVKDSFIRADSAQDILTTLKERMPKDWDGKKSADHKRHVFDRGLNPPTEYIAKDDPRVRPAVSISFFGSASTRRPEHLELARESVKMCADRKWGMVNGGGFNGVMGAQMLAAKASGVYLHGISTDDRNALAISGTEKDKDTIIGSMAKYTECKDMIHRIEYYLQDSDGIALLDGGLGSAQELFMVLELFREQHILTKYQDVNGKWYDKPFLIVDKNKTWAPMMEWAKEKYGEEYVAPVKVVHSMQEAEKIYADQFEQFKPKLPTEVIDRYVYEAENSLKAISRLTAMDNGKIISQVKHGRPEMVQDWQSTMALVELTERNNAATGQDISELCAKANLQHVRAVSVPAQWIEKTKSLLTADAKISTLITSDEAISAIRDAKAKGANEIGLSFPRQLLMEGRYRECADRLNQAVDEVHSADLIHPSASAKIVLDASELTARQIAMAGIIARQAHAQSVQLTSANIETIEIMRRSVGNKIGVGCGDMVNDFETAMAMVDAGASSVSAPPAGLSLTSTQQTIPYATIDDKASKLPPYARVEATSRGAH